MRADWLLPAAKSGAPTERSPPLSLSPPSLRDDLPMVRPTPPRVGHSPSSKSKLRSPPPSSRRLGARPVPELQLPADPEQVAVTAA